MSRKDKIDLKNVYANQLLNEMNLGTNVDTDSGGLGSPSPIIVRGIHKPSDYQPAPCCGSCGSCSEDEEHYADERGCCKKCGGCHESVSQEDAESSVTDHSFSNKVKVSLHDSGDNFKRFNDYEVHDATVNYSIDLEFRTWGLKDITVSGLGEIHISVTGIIWTDEARDKEEAFNIVVEASKVKNEYNKASSSKYINGIYIDELDVYLLPNMQVDYSKSYFTVSC